ncbi:UNVERIFIED_CONTAM: hypothetical protein GTU68_033226 [Idotea baltica]|nr:hypothetical protein [Idotea baltica]
MIQKIGKQFRLHPLVMEDILNTGQRPRIEVHQDYIYVVLRMLQIEKDSQELRSEQISLVIGDGWLLSFQEREVDSFATIRTRVESGAGRIRRKGTDYLGFSLIDAIVDQYYLVLEDLGDRIERLEEELFESHDNNHLITLQGMKREVIALRKSIWPLREAINNLSKVESEIISRDSLVYFRDAYDHTIQIIDTIESYRDIIGGVQDLYLSVVNNKMNEVMKMLALISTIFLPLTLMAGIYGMNFKVMPELEWEWGYPALMVAMLGVGIGMFFYFKSRKWL